MDWITKFFNTIGDWFVKSGSKLWDSALDNLGLITGSLLKAVLILFLGWWAVSLLVRAISGMLKKGKVEAGIQTFTCSCIKIGLRLIIVVSAIAALGINITSIITALGAAGITLGLAMKDSLSNFASGVLILFNRPFKAGDYIEFEGSSGTVERIELMYTVLRSPDNKEVIYPNSKITADRVINYTAQEDRRLDLTFPISYDCNLDQARQVLMQVCAESEYVDNSAENVVGISELAANAVVLELRAWIRASQYWEAYYDIHERVLAAFRKNGMIIPCEKLDVRVRQG